MHENADEFLHDLLAHSEEIRSADEHRDAPDREVLLAALQDFDDDQLRALDQSSGALVRAYRRVSGAIRAERLRRRKLRAS